MAAAAKTAPDKSFVTVGKVVKPHGIRGEFSMHLYADSPLLFDEIGSVFLFFGKGRPKRFAVSKWRKHKGMILMTLEKVEDRDRAEELRGAEVLVRTRDLPEIDDDEVYLYQLEGLRVELSDGTEVGVLSGFIETPQQETWSITMPNGKELLLPAVPEFVLDIDLDAERIVIDPPEGLLDVCIS
ncbi:ribosome maturation factor RimM [Salidesulfovibrio brasiliensis]|uniref:ribosome maturation factor RimM n=1 Tax=Salidesulfovibrio brasiliensis TaxID=221711 RepID=UPI0006D208DB|nr:ribosome maturation factor RimM [Salidesulfovibrio brasiliensis]